MFFLVYITVHYVSFQSLCVFSSTGLPCSVYGVSIRSSYRLVFLKSLQFLRICIFSRIQPPQIGEILLPPSHFLSDFQCVIVCLIHLQPVRVYGMVCVLFFVVLEDFPVLIGFKFWYLCSIGFELSSKIGFCVACFWSTGYIRRVEVTFFRISKFS